MSKVSLPARRVNSGRDLSRFAVLSEDGEIIDVGLHELDAYTCADQYNRFRDLDYRNGARVVPVEMHVAGAIIPPQPDVLRAGIFCEEHGEERLKRIVHFGDPRIIFCEEWNRTWADAEDAKVARPL